MSEKPILFSGEMVRAILKGRKTQTRRVIKFPDDWEPFGFLGKENEVFYSWNFGTICGTYPGGIKCPWNVGMRLWVRETWGIGCRPDPNEGWRDGIEYRAEEFYLEEHDDLPCYPIPKEIDYDDYCKFEGRGWRPSIHMPRWASRINLLIKNIRVERIQDISEEDALKEGIHDFVKCNPIGGFKILWDSINEKRGFGWDLNPWVWVIDFEKDAGK